MSNNSGGGGGGLAETALGTVGSYVAADAASGDKSKAQGYAEQAFNELLAIGMPPDLSKEIILQHFQEAGQLTPEMEQSIEQAYSSVAQMQEDQTGRDAQLEALSKFKNLSKTGLGAEDRAALNQVRDSVQRDLEGKRQQILQGFQARGMGGSGAELIAQLQGAQSGANQASLEGDRLAAMAQSRALQALSQSANLGGQIRNQDYDAAFNKARAQDELNRFNVSNQIARQQRNVASQNQAEMANLQNKQAIMNANVGQANNELYRQSQAKRDYWNDQIKRAQLRSGAYKGLSGEYGDRAQDIAARKQAEWTGWGKLVDQGFKAWATGGASEAMPDLQGTANPQAMPAPQYNAYNERKMNRIYNDPYGYSDGGMVPGDAPYQGDHPANDVVPADLSPGEIVIPRSIVQHQNAPEASKKFVDLMLALNKKGGQK